ncbi:MAG TPA: hypothetical protein VKZ51_10305 [Cyclobacteriaceae bacterium]|nr:hypothetical protein [Cyclobacteriaceae bacterium]
MKIPFVRIAKPHRFNITPRYYDPIKEEIDNRTLAIKKQLEAEGKLRTNPDEVGEDRVTYGSSIRGSFRTKSRTKGTPLLFQKSGLLRLFIFAMLVGVLGGYLYLGADFLYYLFYAALGISVLVVLLRWKGRQKDE